MCVNVVRRSLVKEGMKKESERVREREREREGRKTERDVCEVTFPPIQIFVNVF